MDDNPIVSTISLCFEKLRKMEFTDEKSINHAAELFKMIRRVPKRNLHLEFPQNIFLQSDFEMLIRMCLDKTLVNTVLHKYLYKVILEVLLEDKRYKRDQITAQLMIHYDEFCNLFDEIQLDGQYNTKCWIFSIMGSLMYTGTQEYSIIYPKFNIEVANSLFYGNQYYCYYLFDLVRNPMINYEHIGDIVQQVIINSAAILSNIDPTRKESYKIKVEMKRASYCIQALSCCTRYPDIFISTVADHDFSKDLEKLIEHDSIYGNIIDLLRELLNVYTELPFSVPIFGIFLEISYIAEQNYHLSKYINIAENAIRLASLLVERNQFVDDIAQQCYELNMNMLINNITEIGMQYAYLEMLFKIAKINNSYQIVSDEISLQLAKAFIADDEPLIALEFLIIRLQNALSNGNSDEIMSVLDQNDIEMIGELQSNGDERVSAAAKTLSGMISQISH